MQPPLVKTARKVLTTEKVPIPRTTVEGLLEAVRDAFSLRGSRVERLRYERGRQELEVERWVASDREPPKDSEFLTPYSMIVQHAQVDIQEPGLEPLVSMARAVQQLTSERYKLSMIVCESKEVVRRWLGRDLRPEDIWQVPLLEDPDMHENGVFVVGSSRGLFIQDIEAAVFCRIGD